MAELLFRDDPYLAACEASVVSLHENAVELDRTVFYPLGGGQAGDTGRIGEWRVLDTRKGGDSILHLLEPGARPEPGMKLPIEIDWERRYRLMRLHTALHLLGAVVKAPVTGGRIGDDKAHLDFDIEMDKLVKEPEALARYSIPHFIELAGAQGIEFLNWMAMRGALTGKVSEAHRNYHIPISNTAAATMVLDNVSVVRRSARPAKAEEKVPA